MSNYITLETNTKDNYNLLHKVMIGIIMSSLILTTTSIYHSLNKTEERKRHKLIQPFEHPKEVPRNLNTRYPQMHANNLENDIQEYFKKGSDNNFYHSTINNRI